ncbi:MAG: hypothetical protein ABIH63_00735 [archaeon]
MRRYILLILIIIFSSVIYAETKTAEKLNIGSQETVYGKTLTILDAAADGSVKVEVDGKKGVITYGDYSTEINGMRLLITNYTYIDETFVQITMEITVEASCGDGVCNTNLSETNESCCTDCGCTTGTCISNVCRIAECDEDKECDDNNKCTTDTCNVEKKCEHTQLTECKSDDGCCPEGCNNENDNDCEAQIEQPQGECQNDQDCEDNNACTTDKCEGEPKACTHETTEGCDYKGKCYKVTERAENVYCTEEGMKQQKENQQSCDNNYECLENACTKNLCGKESKKGMYIGTLVAVLTFLTLVFMGYSLFKKKNKEQDLNPPLHSDNT